MTLLWWSSTGLCADNSACESVVFETPLRNVETASLGASDRWLLTCGPESFGSLREVSTGRILRQFDTPSESHFGRGLNLVACRGIISADGSRVAISQGKTVYIWDAASGRLVSSLKGLSEFVKGISLSGDGSRLLTCYEKLATVWDTQTGRRLKTYRKHVENVTAVVMAADKSIAISADYTGAIHVWNPESGDVIHKLQVDKKVSALAISSDGLRMVSGADVATLWDTRSGKQIHRFSELPDGGAIIGISADGNVIANSNGKSAEIWSTETAQRLCSVDATEHGVTCLALNRDGSQVTIGYSGRESEIRDTATGTTIRGLGNPKGPWHFDFIGQSGHRACSREGTATQILDPATREPLLGILKSRRLPEISDDENRLLIHDTVIDLMPPRQLRLIDNGRDGWYVLSGDGRRVAAQTNPATTVIILDAETGDEICRWKPGPAVTTVSLSKDGSKLSHGSAIWNVADQKQIQTLAIQPNANIMTTRISPDGNFAAGAVFDTNLFSAGGSICVWDATTGQMVKTVRSGTGSGEYFFSCDGKHVFTTSGFEPDGRVLMADVASGKRLATFLGVPGSIEIVAEIGTQKLVAAGSQGRTLVWDPETGAEICRFIHVGTSHEWICITPRGYFECSDSGREFVHFRIADTLDFVNDADTFNRYHRPKLFARILAGERDVDFAQR